MENSNLVRAHTLTIDSKKKLNATGIDEVAGFCETSVSLLGAGGAIVISGSGLKISRFSKTDGTLEVEGSIDGVRYSQAAQKGSLLKRILK